MDLPYLCFINEKRWSISPNAFFLIYFHLVVRPRSAGFVPIYCLPDIKSPLCSSILFASHPGPQKSHLFLPNTDFQAAPRGSPY